jgi:4-hydroxythreonine-4-phosphate dehydrogenase
MNTRIAVTMGDPCGIGPEIVLKALVQPLPHGALPVVFGSSRVLRNEDARLTQRVPGYTSQAHRFAPLTAADQAIEPGQIGVVEAAPALEVAGLVPGQAAPQAALLQLAALDAAIEAARTGQVAAICTAPWTKHIFALVDMPAIGHTERLAAAFGAEDDHVMMLAGDVLRVALVTTHVPLARVSAALTHQRLVNTIATTARDLTRWFGVARPHIAVASLNPHAGEGGHMGREEIEVMQPAIEAARRLLPDATITDPLPPDTLFARFHGGKKAFDAVVCMYHDQGLIPLKLLHFGSSANITLGLPVLRTSVDHGTAYDIAGQGRADPNSMRYAIELALRLTSRR